MPITRAKAVRLLNQREMALYDDSRANALRRLDAKALATRITRARTASDRAHDLARRQARTAKARGTDAAKRSRDKAEVITDILARFEAAAKQARIRDAGRSTNRKAIAKPAAKKAGAKAAPGKSATRTSTAKAADTRQVVAGKAARKASAPARKRRAAAKRGITPGQALAQTHALLEAKHAHDAEPRPWRENLDGASAIGRPGFQSGPAAQRAHRLHAAESRMSAIQGSMSTRDRISQGKRDHRTQGDD